MSPAIDMKIIRVSLGAGLALGFFVSLAARAQQEQLVLDPPLSQVFPLELKPGGVGVRYPVLLNDHTILRPDAILRFIYLEPNGGLHAGGGDDNHLRALNGPHGTLQQNDNGTTTHGEGPSGAWGRGDFDEDAGIFDHTKSDDPKRSKSELQNEKWGQPDLFAQALDHASDEGTTVVYNLPAQPRPTTATIDLPEGMLLAEVDGRVRVLALSHESRAFAGGLQPGDEIRSLGGRAVGTLEDFLRAYAETRRQARVSGISSYAMEVWRPDEGRAVSVQIAAPPSIPSFL